MRYVKWVGLILLLAVLAGMAAGCEQADPTTNTLGGLFEKDD